jgi:hypothetical protein
MPEESQIDLLLLNKERIQLRTGSKMTVKF